MEHQPYVPPTKEQFEAMSPAEKRVAIARDVLAQLWAGTIIPETGYYVVHEGIKNGVEVCELADQKCGCCAIGAAVLSACRIGRFTPDPKAVSDDERIRSSLLPYFLKEQLDLIEAAFEECDDLPWFTSASDDLHPAMMWASGNESDRLQQIFENIIANNGEFKPGVSL